MMTLPSKPRPSRGLVGSMLNRSVIVLDDGSSSNSVGSKALHALLPDVGARGPIRAQRSFPAISDRHGRAVEHRCGPLRVVVDLDDGCPFVFMSLRPATCVSRCCWLRFQLQKFFQLMFNAISMHSNLSVPRYRPLLQMIMGLRARVVTACRVQRLVVPLRVIMSWKFGIVQPPPIRTASLPLSISLSLVVLFPA